MLYLHTKYENVLSNMEVGQECNATRQIGKTNLILG